MDSFYYLSLLIMSKYFQTLTGDAHERYLDKIEIIGGEDVMLVFPSSTYFDIINYLAVGSSLFYIMMEFKNYKS